MLVNSVETFSNFILIIIESNQFNSKLNIAITVNIAIFLKTFFNRTPLVATSELKSNINDTNLGKNKKKLFLYFDTSHGNQTKFVFIHC